MYAEWTKYMKNFEFDSGGRRGHSCKLFKKRTRLDIRKFAFSRERERERILFATALQAYQKGYKPI